MKRNCNKCKALDESNMICTLGHDIIVIDGVGKPQEECEKPTSIKKYNELLDSIDVDVDVDVVDEDIPEIKEEVLKRTPQEIFNEWDNDKKSTHRFKQRNWTSLH